MHELKELSPRLELYSCKFSSVTEFRDEGQESRLFDLLPFRTSLAKDQWAGILDDFLATHGKGNLWIPVQTPCLCLLENQIYCMNFRQLNITRMPYTITWKHKMHLKNILIDCGVQSPFKSSFGLPVTSHCSPSSDHLSNTSTIFIHI